MVPLRMLFSLILIYFFKVTYLKVLISETVRASAKFAWYGFYRILYLQWYGTIANVTVHDLDLLFHDQIFKMIISQKPWELVKNASWGLYVLYLPSNGAITKVVLSDLDLPFQGQIFQILISWTRWELAHKKVKYNIYIFWYLPLNATVAKVILDDLHLLS